MWFFELIRKFFFSLDRIIYNFIPSVYDLLISIARTSVLTQADIIKMAERIYSLLAIFMVFKVTLSLITYVVNPDDFSDKSKGLSKLGTNIIISLSLLVLTPYIFRYAYQLQSIILKDNSLATLIFGKNENGDNFLNSAGEEMAYIAITPFFLPDTSIPQQINCIRLITVEEDGSSHFNSDCSGLDENYNKLSSGTDRTMVALTEDNDEFDETALKNYVLGVEKRNFKMMFRKEILVAQDGDKNFVIEYKYILSTIVGVVIILLLINFCMDVALRSIKLAFLQLIAPIPILSYVDPKSGKDGLFKKWYQMCFKTFASLFVRLLALYFALYIIWMVADGKMVDIIDGSYQTNLLIKIFIIIGALMFAKQLPKILEGLGIKLDGDGKFFLNPFKKFENQALGGKQILGGAKGLAAGTMIGAAGMLSGAGKGRLLSGMAGGLKSGIQGKKFGEIRKDQANKNAEMRRAIASGSTWLGRRGAQLSGYFGTPGALGSVEHDKIQTQNHIDNLKAQKKTVQDRIAPKKAVISKQQAVKKSIDGMESFATSLIEGGKAGKYSAKYKQLSTDHEYLTNNIGQIAAYDVTDASGKIVIRAGEKIEGRHAQTLNGEKERFSKKVGREAVMNEMLQRKDDPNVGGEIGQNDVDNFAAQYYSYSKDVEDYNDTVKNYKATTSQEDQDALKNEGISIEEISNEGDFGKLHSQSGDLNTLSTYVQASIKDQEAEIEQIDRNVQSYEVQLEELNAQEKIAKADVEVTHATQGGPARPSSISQATSTVGRRSGGPGSGMGPMGPMGPGPGGPRP